MMGKAARYLSVGIVLAVCAGLALAQQAPGRGDEAQRERPGAPQGRAGGGLHSLLAGDGAEVTVTNVDDGVQVKITAKPEMVRLLQARAEAAVLEVEHLAGRAAERLRERAEAPAGRAPVGVMGLLLRGDAQISAENVDGGVVLHLSSEKPELVETLQEATSRWVAQVRERAGQARDQALNAGRNREVLRLLASKDVQVKAIETDKGVTITVDSDNPDIAARIKEEIPDSVEALKELARQLAERRQADAEGRPRRLEEGVPGAARPLEEGAAGGRRGGRFGAPLAPEE